MKYKVVKEINICVGCINPCGEMCGDFKKQRMSEGLPDCEKGFIYVEDNEVKETKLKFNKELLLDKPVAIKVETAEQFKAILDWCRDEFDYYDIDKHYNSYNGSSHIGIKRDEWTWGALRRCKALSFEDALLKEPKVEEYKEITLDMSVRELMALDLDRVEFYAGSTGWEKSLDRDFIYVNLTNGTKYRYKIKPLKPMKITQQLMNDLLDCICNKEEIEKKYGRKVEIIE